MYKLAHVFSLRRKAVSSWQNLGAGRASLQDRMGTIENCPSLLD